MINVFTFLLFAVFGIFAAAAPTTLTPIDEPAGYTRLKDNWAIMLMDGATCEETLSLRGSAPLEFYSIFDGHQCDFFRYFVFYTDTAHVLICFQ